MKITVVEVRTFMVPEWLEDEVRTAIAKFQPGASEDIDELLEAGLDNDWLVSVETKSVEIAK